MSGKDLNNKTDEIIHVLNDSVKCPNCKCFASDDNPMGRFKIEEKDEYIAHTIYSQFDCKNCFKKLIDGKDCMTTITDTDDYKEYFENINRGKTYTWRLDDGENENC